MIDFATGSGLKTIHWTQQEAANWDEFVTWLRLDKPADHKECGGYVGGLLQETKGHSGKPDCVALHRNARAVVERSLVALDVDSASSTFVLDVSMDLGCAMVLYTTWSHTPAAPRWRLLAPLSRAVKPDEYRLLVGALMHDMGEDQFDRGSREPERLMHRPSTQGHYVSHVLPGEPLDADLWLARADELGLALERLEVRERYVDDSPVRPVEEGLHPRAQGLLETQEEALKSLPVPWFSGAEWDNGVFKVACVLVELANSNWSGYTMEQAERDLLEWAPTDDVWGDPENLAKFHSAQDRVAGGARPMPDDTTPEQDFAAGSRIVWPEVPRKLNDAYLAEWIAHAGLKRDWRWSRGLGWLHWSGRVWETRTEEGVKEALRRCMLKVTKLAMDRGAGAEFQKALVGLLSNGRLSALVQLTKGVVEVDAGSFDQQKDMLNCGNGVVDLRTGQLLPHDRELLMTKITETGYVPGARHADWDQALLCMEPEVADWMQVRFGQAATGWPTSDDVLPVGQGGGSNGKSTLLAGLFGALGAHMVLVPAKLIRSNPSDHPTELMTLFGARVAVIDELPEAGHLDIARLKSVVGATVITARAVFKDNVSWVATHSLFVMTNYTPGIAETDHGTWRRLALVRFGKTFARDDTFRARISRGEDGRAEAVLAWVVAGAVRWYRADRILPSAPGVVERDTLSWREESDPIMAYLRERLVFSPAACVASSELLEDFNDWLSKQQQRPWSAKLFAARFGGHMMVTDAGVSKTRSNAGFVSRDPLYVASEDSWKWAGLSWK